MEKLNRREMLSSGVAVIAGAALSNAYPASHSTTNDGEYLFQPGLIYLNTGSLGPTPRSILEEVIKVWNQTETNPVAMSYGRVQAIADRTRDAIAGLVRCSADEVLLTRSTTNAMNIAALGIDLSPGDRVLTTDAEHEGGTACWKYLEKRRGIGIDRVAIPRDDHDVRAIIDRFDRAITKQTKVISVSHVIWST